MRLKHRPFLSLIVCLALAVTLLAPFASASPLFIEICSGHRTVLVPMDDAETQVSCEACPVCCVSVLPPDEWTFAALDEPSVGHGAVVASHAVIVILPRRVARAPPLLSI